jgi:ATP/maltotriose-dependent transcriptional regulator MalT
MLLADLERQEPGLSAVLRRRAASWCLRNDLPEEALEYSMAAGDADAAAGLMEKLAVPAHRQGRVPTIQRWFGWLEERGGIEGHPMAAVLAALLFALTGRPVEAERWADAVDRWQYGDPARPGDPSTEAWGALLRAFLCRRGAERMRADAEEAVRRFAAGSFVTPALAILQGSRVSCAVTSMAATRPWRMVPASGRKLARTKMSRSRCANGRWCRWRAATGAGPGFLRTRQALFCAGPGSRKATQRLWSAPCKPG